MSSDSNERPFYDQFAEAEKRYIERTRKGNGELALKNENMQLFHMFHLQPTEVLDEALEFATFVQSSNVVSVYSYRAYQYSQRGQFDKALEMYDGAIKLNGELAGLYANRGGTYYQLGDEVNALHDLNHALDLDPQSIHALLNRAVIYEKQAKYSLALDDLNKALSINDKFVQLYQHRGNVHYAMNNFNLAILDYSRIIELFPNTAHPYITRGVAYLQSGNIENALSDLRFGVSLEPENPDYLSQLHMAELAHRENLQIPLDSTNSGIEKQDQNQSPDVARFYFQLALGKEGEKDFKSAIVYYKHAISLDPIEIHFAGLTMLLFKLREFDDALNVTNQMISHYPKLAMAFCLKGHILIMKGLYRESLAPLNQAIEIDPKLGQAFKLRGMAYASQNMKLDALDDFSQAIQLKTEGADKLFESLQAELIKESLNALKLITSQDDLGQLLARFPFIADTTYIEIARTMATLYPATIQLSEVEKDSFLNKLSWLEDIATDINDKNS